MEDIAAENIASLRNRLRDSKNANHGVAYTSAVTSDPTVYFFVEKIRGISAEKVKSNGKGANGY